jgi:UDP-glucose 4-epimerase
VYASIKRIIEVEADRLNVAGADNRILRLTNVYGGKDYLEKKNTVVKKFVKAKELNAKLIINGKGEQIRDFLHVEDVCDAICRCVLYNDRILEPIDIGTGVGVSILELAEMFDSEFTLVPESDIVGADESVADPEFAKELFGFVAFPAKLKEYINSFFAD